MIRLRAMGHIRSERNNSQLTVVFYDAPSFVCDTGIYYGGSMIQVQERSNAQIYLHLRKLPSRPVRLGCQLMSAAIVPLIGDAP